MAEGSGRQGSGGEESKTGFGMEGYWMLHIEITTNCIRSIGENRVTSVFRS